MKISFNKYLAILLLLFAGVINATELQYFYAKSENGAILLEWKTGIENNLSHFEIERSASNPNNFVSIGTVTAIGNNSYYYFQDELGSENSIFYYRLKLVNHNGSHVYSNTITVTHIISGIKSTWGSIKSIFR